MTAQWAPEPDPAAFVAPAPPTPCRWTTYVWSEEAGRLAVRERSGGRCEGCGQGGADTFAHRVRRGQGGPWSPVNGLALCGSGTTGCHGWSGHNPDAAKARGWEVPSTGTPEHVPAWIWHDAAPGWWLLTYLDDPSLTDITPRNAARAHVLVPVDPADYGLPYRPEEAP